MVILFNSFASCHFPYHVNSHYFVFRLLMFHGFILFLDDQKKFMKIDSDKWEFGNEGFQKGKKHMLKHIKRGKQTYNN